MATPHDDNRQHAEGVFSKSVVQQIQEQINYYAQPPDKDQLKHIVSQVLVDSLPELVKQPAIAQEIRDSTYKALSAFIDQKHPLADSDLIAALSSVLRYSEVEVGRALATVADRAVERAFREREIVYKTLDVAHIAPRERRIYELYLSKGECLEFYTGIEDGGLYGSELGSDLFLAIHSPSQGLLETYLPDASNAGSPVHFYRNPQFFVPSGSGIYDFRFLNVVKNGYPGSWYSLPLFYRVRVPPKVGSWNTDALYPIMWEDAARARR